MHNTLKLKNNDNANVFQSNIFKFTEKVQQVNIPATSVGRKVFTGQKRL